MAAYSATTRTGARRMRLSFLETNDSQVVLQTDLLNSRFKYAIVENLKNCLNLPLGNKLNLWMLLVRSQKQLRIVCFLKPLCLNNVFPSAWFEKSHCNRGSTVISFFIYIILSNMRKSVFRVCTHSHHGQPVLVSILDFVSIGAVSDPCQDQFFVSLDNTLLLLQ